MAQQTPEVDWKAITAVYGAVVSTFLAVRQFIKDRRQVRVTCHISLVFARPESDGEEHFEISAVNTGHRPVIIRSAGFLTNNGETIINTDWLIKRELPRKLEDGEWIRLLLSWAQVEKALRERGEHALYTSAFVQDSEDKRYGTRLPRIVYDRGLARRRWRLPR